MGTPTLPAPRLSSPSLRAGRVLLVDDEPEQLRASERVLSRAGLEIATARDGETAIAAIRAQSFDAVVSDISMPGLDGIGLLRFMRQHDEDVPVILMTAAPAVETAVEALEHGAYKYLVKPVSAQRLEEVVQKAVGMRRMAVIRRQAVEIAVATDELAASFASAMDSLWIAYQPIVRRNGELFGYEALLRSREPKLPHPGAVLDAAERLDQLNELGRRVRELAAEPVADKDVTLFVNLHPRDLEDEALCEVTAPLAKIASRVVLEITERASVDSIQDLRIRVSHVRETGFRIAVDDLGAGYAGLTSFALLEPEIVKIDMSLVRDVDKQPVKQRLIQKLASLCGEMNIMSVAEGVETAAERDMLMKLGCDLFQGYFIAKPDKPFPTFRW
jgi:EAL domain-containing protein (putative c-di-GMP-specific phosphodiesterase class I)